MASDHRSHPADRNAAGTPAASWPGAALFLRLAELGWLAEAGFVAAAIAALTLALAPLAWLQGGSASGLALAVAAGATLLAGLLASVAGRLFRGPKAPMYGMVAGMLARMSVALAVAVIVKRGVPELAGGALIFYLLVFYLVALAIETAILLAKIRPDTFRAGTFQAGAFQAGTARPNCDGPDPALPKAV